MSTYNNNLKVSVNDQIYDSDDSDKENFPSMTPFTPTIDNVESHGENMSGGDALPSGSEKLFGMKDRRRSSVYKNFLGDYMNLSCEGTIRKMLQKFDEKAILFADIVTKINKRNKMQQRVLLVTEKAVYNIDPAGKKYKLKRRIELNQIGDIKMSKLADNFFCMHVPSEYDYLMESSKKSEIVTRISEAYEKVCNRPLTVSFSNCFQYRIDTNVFREIQFAQVQGGISTKIFTQRHAE